MNKYLQAMLTRYMAPADDGGSAGGTAIVDRGDTLAAGAPPAPEAQADAAAEAERIRAEEVAAKAAEGGEGGAAAAEEGADADGKKSMIPVERHKAVLDKARAERDALAAEVDRLKQGQVVVQTNADITKIEESIIAKETEYNKLLVEGEVEKATAAMREIRALERQASDLKVEMRTQAATAQAIESVRYSTVVERLEAAYPALNPDHESFDRDQVQDVMDLKDTYQRRGASPSAALQKAVEKLMPATTIKQENATTITPRVDKAAVTAATRKEDATGKAVDAATRTPPSAAKVGIDSDKLGGGAITAETVMKMGQNEFRKLDEKTLAQLRGDEL